MATYTGSIADLIMNSGRLQAQRVVTAANIAAQGQQRLAEIAAQDALLRRQNDPSAAIMQTISGTLGDILQYKSYDAQNKRLAQRDADQRALQQRQIQALDDARNNEYQSRRAMMPRAAGGGPDDSAYAPPAPLYGPRTPQAPPGALPVGGGPDDAAFDPDVQHTRGLSPGMLPPGPTVPLPGAAQRALQDGSSASLPGMDTATVTPASRLDPNRMVKPTRQEMIEGQPTNAAAQQLTKLFQEVDDHAMKVKEATDKAKKVQDDGLGLLAIGATENGGVDPKTGRVTDRAWYALLDEAEKLGVPKARLDEYDLQRQADPDAVLPMLQSLINRSEPARALRKENEERAKPVVVPQGSSIWDAKTRTYIENPNKREAPDYTLGDSRYSGTTNQPIATNQRAVALKEAAAAAARIKASAEAGESAASKDDTKLMMDGIENGTLPPLLPGRASPQYVALSAEAARRGFDLAGAVTDWVATQKYISTRNGSQQIRLNQSINSLPEMLDTVEALAQQWDAGRFPVLNKVSMEAAINGANGDEAAAIATQLKGQIADVVADLGNVYMGGNSPTDHALKLAQTALNENWSRPVLMKMIALARKNVKTRRNSINNTGVQGASADNPYAPEGAAGGRAPLTAPPPAPPGWRYEKNAQGGWTAVQAP